MSIYERITTRPGYRLLLVAALILVAGHIESQEQAPVVVVKSPVQERIETILPAAVAKPIAERTAYPRTMAAIAHTESRGNHKAVGDRGASRGAFQVQAKHWGVVPDSIEAQVDQANKVFIALVNEYGYREAVKRWNGDGPAARRYQRVVLAKVAALQ